MRLPQRWIEGFAWIGLLLAVLSAPAAGQTTYTVNTIVDANTTCDALGTGTDCSLREAIDAANANGGADIIEFNIPGSSSIFTLTLTMALPPITEAVTIDGTSQPGWAVGSPVVELLSPTQAFDGITINSGGSSVSGLIIRGFLNGIVLQTVGSNVIQGNFIGTNPAGDGSLGNAGGISVLSGVNTIGGTTAAHRNVISANTAVGIWLDGPSARNNVVSGNYIGVDPAGTAALGNVVVGIRIENGAALNTIGGALTGEGNIISGNGDGIRLAGSTSNNNTIEGNYVGVDVTGTVALANTQEGLEIRDGTGTIIRGNVISGNLDNGIELRNARQTQVEGNLIGTDVNGTNAVANGSPGILLDGGAKQSQIGGPTPAQGNVISGNPSAGIFIANGATTGTKIHGNLIGTDITGTVDLGNGAGVHVRGAPGVEIGGPNPGEGNVISGNVLAIEIEQSASVGTMVTGNLIGTDINGTTAIGNTDYGIWVHTFAQTSFIGGAAAGAGNVIAGNGKSGIAVERPDQVIEGNWIGVGMNGTPLPNGEHGVWINASDNTVGGSATGAGNVIAHNSGDGVRVLSGTGNLISGNSIHGNVGLGIDLDANGPTPNDSQDPDMGPNDLQNFPVITAASGGLAAISGTFNSVPNASFTLEFFATGAAACAAGSGVGETHIHSEPVMTDGNGDVTGGFMVTTSSSVPAGDCITATATDGVNNTSELSAPVTTVDFAVALSPTTQPINRGDAATYTVDVSVSGGTLAGDVTLACTGLPAGVNCVFDSTSLTPGSGSATTQVTVSTTAPGTPTGTLALTVEGTSTSNSAKRSGSADLVVEEFSIAVSPPTANVVQGDDAVYLVSVDPDPSGGISSSVALACGGTLPAGVTCSFAPGQVTPSSGSATSTLTVTTTDPDTPVGSATLAIEGTAGNQVRSGTATLEVTDVATDYTVALSPPSRDVVRGESATYTVTVAPITGGSFDQAVTLSCSDLPAEASCTFTESSVTPGSSDATSTLTVSTKAPDTPTGTATFTVAGVAGSISRSATADLNVTKDFAIAVDPQTISLSGGTSQNVSVTVAQMGHFDEEVSLSCSDLPAGLSCSFDSDAVTPNDQDVTVTLTVSGAASLASLLTPNSGRADPKVGWWLAISLIGLSGVGRLRRRRWTSRARVWSSAGAAVVLLLGAAACGAEANLNPDQQRTESFEVTGTAGSTTRSASVTVTIG